MVYHSHLTSHSLRKGKQPSAIMEALLFQCQAKQQLLTNPLKEEHNEGGSSSFSETYKYFGQ